MTKKEIIITHAFNKNRIIGKAVFINDSLALIDEHSVFAIGYTQKKGGGLDELLEISLIRDENYIKYVDRVNNNKKLYKNDNDKKRHP